MKRLWICALTAVIVTLVIGSGAIAQTAGTTGLRVGVGTDIGGGLAYGAELNHIKMKSNSAIELAVGVYGGKFEEDSEENGNEYHEETEIFVVAVLANYLLDYGTIKSPYFVFGVGAGLMSIDWLESSPTDGSLGVPFGTSGSIWEEDASAGGMILNLGAGYRFSEKVDLRAQVPTFLIFGAPGEAGSTVPTFTVTLGIRF